MNLTNEFDCEDFPDWMYQWMYDTFANWKIPEIIDLTGDDPDADLKRDLEIEQEEKSKYWIDLFNSIQSHETVSYFRSVDHLIPDSDEEAEAHMEWQLENLSNNK